MVGLAIHLEVKGCYLEGFFNLIGFSSLTNGHIITFFSF